MLPREAPLGERAARAAARPLSFRGRTAAALLAALALALVGCGGDDEEGPVSEAETELEITLDPDGEGEGEALVAMLECPGADRPAAACAAVAELPEDPAAAPPPGTACTEIYGGPDVATIEGTLEGEAISAELTRENGCEIERFQRFAPVLSALFPDYTPGEELRPPGG